MSRRLISSCFRAWCLFPHGRERRTASWLRQLLLLATAFFLAQAAGRRNNAGLESFDINSMKSAYRTFPGNLSRLHPPQLQVRTFESDVKDHSGKRPSSSSKTPKRILFMSYEIAGPHMNGGIGTAFRNLAESLASRGHNVSVVVVTGSNSNPNSGRTWQQWVDTFRTEYNIALDAFPNHPKAWDASPHLHSYDLKKARQAYEWLLPRENDYDIIHFHEWRGLSYFITESKKLGLHFQNTLLVTGTHGPDLWAHMASLRFPDEKLLEPDFLERKAVERADIVISPSRYMLHWMNEMGWPLAQRLVSFPNVLSQALSSLPQVRTKGLVKATEFVFFGRLETRKGIQVFTQAMEQLTANYTSLKITLIGKAESETILMGLPKTWTVYTNFSIEAAHRYLKADRGRVAVVPSLIDNSPYTILECLVAGIPLLASNTGGNAELFHPDFHKSNMFYPESSYLLKLAREAVVRGIPVARPAMEPNEAHEMWGKWHESVPTRIERRRLKEAEVSVVAVVEQGSARAAVESLSKIVGDWKGEVVLVMTGMIEKVEVPSNWKLVTSSSSKVVFALLNLGLQSATNGLLLFVDLAAQPRLDVEKVTKPFVFPEVELLVVPSYPPGNASFTFAASVPQATGSASLLLKEKNLRVGRSVVMRRSVVDSLRGFDYGSSLQEALLYFLVKADVARTQVFLYPDPFPALPYSPPSLSLDQKKQWKATVYDAVDRYFPQDSGRAVVVADQKRDRNKRLVGDSRKQFSLVQGMKSWWYGYRLRDPDTNKLGNFTLLKSARKICFNAWDCEDRHDEGKDAEFGTIFIGDRKQHPQALYPSGAPPKVVVASRVWVSRTHGNKEVYVFVKRVPNSMCGDGVVIRLAVDERIVESRVMPLNEDKQILADDVLEFDKTVEMKIGGRLELQVDPRKTHDCDGMLVEMQVAEVKKW